MKKTIFLLAFVALATVSSFAQKYGHLNFGELISAMPETEVANTSLKGFQDGLIAAGEERAKKFQEKYVAFTQRVRGGDMTRAQQEAAQGELEKEQAELQGLEEEIEEKINARRSQLLEPIITKAEAAIKEFSKENGYLMVFDTSVFNAVLFAGESDDLMAQIKAKLGIKEKEEKK